MVQRLGAGILASGIAALVLKLVGGQPAKVLTAQALEWQNMPLFDSMALPDPATETIMNQYLQGLSAQGAVTRHQGIWIQSDITVLAKHKDQVHLPAASLTKIATTLAALNK